MHHGKAVQEWLGNYKDEIELFHTSPYSPEINPDEYLNHNPKQNIHSGIMTGLQNERKKVTCLFEHEKLGYIKK